jgi:hypothetical protein
VDRSSWRQLADIRIADAEALLLAGRWHAAYYLAGYAVESGLKACILALVEREPQIIFEERRFSEKCWTHGIGALVALARLEADRDAEAAANPAFRDNWEIVEAWSETDRYTRRPEAEARELFVAVTDPTNGVLPWIKLRW